MRDASLTPLQLQAAPSGEPQPTTLAALLASAAAAASSPLVLFDRHVEKNGGLSMTKAFEESDCQYYGYQVLEHEFEQMVDALAAADTGGSPLRICVNGHSPVPDTWMEQARALGELPQHPRLVTMLRVRRPPDWYQSFYDWDQVPRMDAGWANQSSIVDWMPGDLQSRIVLHSHNAVKAQHRELENAPLNETECARALDLAGSVELLTTTEEMDRMWPVLRKLMFHLRLEGLRVNDFGALPLNR